MVLSLPVTGLSLLCPLSFPFPTLPVEDSGSAGVISVPTAPSGRAWHRGAPVLSGEKGKKWVDGAKNAVGRSKPGGLASGSGAPTGLDGLGTMGEDDQGGHEAGS